jgi:hypothetical protein
MAEGTFQCPILGCGKSKPHAHGLPGQAEEDLRQQRLFLASDGPLTSRAIDAARLLRKAIADVQGIGPNDGTDPVRTEKWRALGMARQVLEVELFYLPFGKMAEE